jgi:hypothetical protein
MSSLIRICFVPRHPRERFPPAIDLWDCEVADATVNALEDAGADRGEAAASVHRVMQALRQHKAKQRTEEILKRIC